MHQHNWVLDSNNIRLRKRLDAGKPLYGRLGNFSHDSLVKLSIHTPEERVRLQWVQQYYHLAEAALLVADDLIVMKRKSEGQLVVVAGVVC